MGESSVEVWRLGSLSQGNSFVFVEQLWHFWVLYQYSMTGKIRYRFFKNFQTNLWVTPIKGVKFWKISRFALLSIKILYSSTKFAIFEHSITQTIRFMLLEDMFNIWIKFFKNLEVCPNFRDKLHSICHVNLAFLSFVPIRFKLGFWQTSKQVYSELLYREKFFEKFEHLFCFPRKIVSFFSLFGNAESCANILLLRSLNLGFSKT